VLDERTKAPGSVGFRARSDADTARIRFATDSHADMTDTTPPKTRSHPVASSSAGNASRDASQSADPLHKIRVDVSANYVGEQSKPDEGHYAFSYTITIRNEGQVPARLLTRHWVITDANGKVKEVRGEGVVGEQPYLLPGQGFRYSSGAVLETPVGAMQGSYQMLADDGAHFDAPIAPFTLAMPGLLH
jgi:ApaG protein